MIQPLPGAEGEDIPSGILWAADELAGWVRVNNQYKGGKGSDRQRWLSSWSSRTLKVDRQKGAIYVTDPAICVVGGIKPDVLGELAHEEGSRDGFIERQLYAWPDVEQGEWNERFVNPDARRAVVELFGALRRPARLCDTVRLDSKAKRLWVQWFNENRRLTRSETSVMAGVYAKLDQQAIRLALVLHALAHPQDYEYQLVSAETMTAAITLAGYFRAHAQRALPRLCVKNRGGAGGLAARMRGILQAHPGEWLNRKALHDATARNFTAEEREAALRQLESDGLAERRQTEPGERGGRPGEDWRVCGAVSTHERTIAQTDGDAASGDDEQGLGVGAFERTSENEPPSTFCGVVLTGTTDACFHCNERPCRVCGEGTGSSLKPFCLRCTMKGEAA